MQKYPDSRRFVLIAALVTLTGFSCGPLYAGNATIIDARHYSKVFGEFRNYRIFLPPGYAENNQKRYPVIYFLHGWSQRYFGSGPNEYGAYEKGNDNGGDNIANFVATHEVIVVKSDGYNRSPGEDYYLRPYNIGSRSEVESFRQFPEYYPELVKYIDATYRTVADREHRGISGLSMGGFMTYWIGGKYPDLFCAAGNFCGSTEFVVGPRDFPVEYNHKDMYRNYEGMNVRLNYGNRDFIRGYHSDINRIWTQVMDDYIFKTYEAEHSTCGMGEMFEFIMNTFSNLPKKPEKWGHIDVYPDFTVWDYQVNTDRSVPGFTVLENVDRDGFRCAVREFLPDGELLPFVNVTVTTPPLYEKNQAYVIQDYQVSSSLMEQKNLISDHTGRLKISLNGGWHEIGIGLKKSRPILCMVTCNTREDSFITPGKDIRLFITLLNKGQADSRNIIARLSATRNTTVVIKNETTIGSIKAGETRKTQVPFEFRINADSIEVAQFRLTLEDDRNNSWTETFELPVHGDWPEIKDFIIADGRTLTVAKAGNDSETIPLGIGNGDGVANPGESIVILIRDNQVYRRANLCFSDPYVNPSGVHHRKSDEWGMFDHVGGTCKYSVPLISSICPENHRIEFLTEYWLPDYPLHIIKRGKVSLPVKGKDSTPPQLEWVQIPGNNVIQAKLYDGTDIQAVKVTLVLQEDPARTLLFELKDDGLNGDQTASDRVFSAVIPGQGFGIYRVVVYAADLYGNTMQRESPEVFVIH